MEKLIYRSFLCFALFFTLFIRPTIASDHGDAPALAQDSGASIGDVYAFQDPGNNTFTVLIATIHGFQIPGMALSEVEFDPSIRYRFEIYNDHVNLTSPVLDGSATAQAKKVFLSHVKPNRTIDVTFGKRQVGPDMQQGTSGQVPTNLRSPLRQSAKVQLTGFTGVRDKGVFTTDSNTSPLQVSPFGVGSSAPNFDLRTISNVTSGKDMQVFFGVVHDPFFFDLPAFTAYLDSFRAGAPNTSTFSRARDTYAGYNTLAIALRIPSDLLKGAGPKIGVDFLTQRPAKRVITNAGSQYSGAVKTVDRKGNPLVDTALIPYDLKNAYATASTKDDVSGKFVGTILESLRELGLATNPPEPFALAILRFAVEKGDLLLLDTTVANTGTNTAAAFPNGRRLQDDAADIFLTFLNRGTTLGDGVNASDGTVTSNFPFLATPRQPLFNTATDDNTRN